MKLNPLVGVLSAAVLAATSTLAPARASVAIDASGTGSLVIEPFGSQYLQETITMSFANTTPFPLTTGILHTDIDPSAPSLDTLLFNAQFSLTAPNGNGLFGSYSLTSSDFSGLTETFSGVFDATSGTGAYAGYFGSGTFSGINVYSDATVSSAVTTMSVSGLLDVPEPSALTLLGFGAGVLAIGRTRRRSE
jgi:hypothetical protein